MAPDRQTSSSVGEPVVMVTRNWLALSLVAPPKLGEAANEPSAAVCTVTERTAAEPPGGMGAPFKKASTVTSTCTPAPNTVSPTTSTTPLTKSKVAVNDPATDPPPAGVTPRMRCRVAAADAPVSRLTATRVPLAARPPRIVRRPIRTGVSPGRSLISVTCARSRPPPPPTRRGTRPRLGRGRTVPQVGRRIGRPAWSHGRHRS
jgi:hypothetical protein